MVNHSPGASPRRPPRRRAPPASTPLAVIRLEDLNTEALRASCCYLVIRGTGRGAAARLRAVIARAGPDAYTRRVAEGRGSGSWMAGDAMASPAIQDLSAQRPGESLLAVIRMDGGRRARRPRRVRAQRPRGLVDRSRHAGRAAARPTAAGSPSPKAAAKPGRDGAAAAGELRQAFERDPMFPTDEEPSSTL